MRYLPIAIIGTILHRVLYDHRSEAKMIRLFALVAIAALAPSLPALAQQTLRAGDWDTRCEVDRMTDRPKCETALTLQQMTPPVGSFVLLFESGTPLAATVTGAPMATGATVRVDRNAPMTCKGLQYCRFTPIEATALARQLLAGNTVLVTVLSSGGVFEFTKEAGHYRTMLAKQQEWGYAR